MGFGPSVLLRLARYIHLNPIRISTLNDASREEKVERLRAYRWSSYPAYAGLGPRQEWMDSRAIAELSRDLLRDRKLERPYHRLETRIAKH